MVKKGVLVLLVAVMLLDYTMAYSIDLNTNSNKNLVNDDSLSRINEQPIVHALIDGYDAIALEIDETRIVILIEDNNITSIKMDEDTEVDFTISTSVTEILDAVQSQEEMSRVDMFKKFLFNKDIPLKVKWRVLAVIING